MKQTPLRRRAGLRTRPPGEPYPLDVERAEAWERYARAGRCEACRADPGRVTIRGHHVI
jgi:hypothetical protein